jgi:rubrerythrin
MTETEAQAAQRLQRVSEEVHIDAALHPDPCGTGLQLLVRAIETHIAEEEVSVEAYRQLACETSDAVVAALMRLLADDEERHHRLFEEIGKTLRDRLDWSADAPPLVDSSRTAEEHAAEWLRRVRIFESDELRGARALRELAHRAHVECEPLVCQLLEAMAMDSDKHAQLLKFVGRRLNTSLLRRGNPEDES